jgi:hypothetical protein
MSALPPKADIDLGPTSPFAGRLVEIKAQFSTPLLGSAEPISDPPRGTGYAENHHQKYVQRCRGPDAFWLRFLPCGDNSHNARARKHASERLAKFSINVMDVLVACFAWLPRFLP